jgi:Rab GDP dissociation inhibitor
MLNRDIDEIVYDEHGKASGVKSGNEMAKAKMVIGDPSYFPRDKIRPTGQVVRCICFLNHAIPSTNDNSSAQIIIPGPQVGRKNDIYVCSVGAAHAVAAKGIYIAIVSTMMEAGKPEDEIAPGLALLGNIMQRFTTVATTYEPVSDGADDQCFISSSFDDASHFENDVNDLLSLYKRVTGEELDMNINADSVESDY